MPFKRDVPPTRIISSKEALFLWNSRIANLTTLQQDHSKSVLVAIDVEKSSQVINGRRKCCEDVVSEVGIAILQLNGQITQPHGGIRDLHTKGGAEAFTIKFLKRIGKPHESVRGEVIESKPEDALSIIKSVISKYEAPLILIGFDLIAEFKWIEKECPALFSCFTAWVDVQDLALQRLQEFSPEPEKVSLPGLTNVLRTMDIHDCRRWSCFHYAVNDALRSLIILCGLASDPFLLSNLWTPQKKFSRHYTTMRTFGAHEQPFIARISAVSGEKLPLWEPQAVMAHFISQRCVKAVGLNWKTEKQKTEGVRYWQLSFHDAESLDTFIAETNGSTLCGIKLLVVRNSREKRVRKEPGNARTEKFDYDLESSWDRCVAGSIFDS